VSADRPFLTITWYGGTLMVDSKSWIREIDKFAFTASTEWKTIYESELMLIQQKEAGDGLSITIHYSLLAGPSSWPGFT